MSTPRLRLSSPIEGAHPAVLTRRLHETLLIGVAGLIAMLVALGIALEVPNPNFLVALGVALGVLTIVVLVVSTRYEVSLVLLMFYFGLLDGPIKLESASQGASVIRDVLIGAICLGAVVRLVVNKERIRLPPLSGWVLAFVALVLVEAANPETKGVTKILGGFRQQLEWIPFFFFGYLVMRSKERFRKFFLILGVLALANGVVSTIQTQLTPAQVASWGPGYSELINGTGNVSGRGYTDSNGKLRVRPMALGPDSGFGGYVGVLALSGVLALFGTGCLSRRWPVAILCIGVLLAVATSLQRTAVLGAVIALVSFGLLSLSAGRRMTRPLAALLVVVVLAFVVGSILGSDAGSGVFSRYASIAPSKAASTAVNYREKDLGQIPTDIKHYPFGAGLSSAGAGRFFGGLAVATIEGHTASGESQYNYVTLELGLPGLILWVALSANLILLAVRRLRVVKDVELRISLAAVFAAVIAFTVMGFAGPTMSSLPFGPYFWFSVGIASYWFADPYHSSGAMIDANVRPKLEMVRSSL